MREAVVLIVERTQLRKKRRRSMSRQFASGNSHGRLNLMAPLLLKWHLESQGQGNKRS
jgi:hypothetical protein